VTQYAASVCESECGTIEAACQRDVVGCESEGVVQVLRDPAGGSRPRHDSVGDRRFDLVDYCLAPGLGVDVDLSPAPHDKVALRAERPLGPVLGAGDTP